jgi:glutamyl-tRNA synthetase
MREAPDAVSNATSDSGARPSARAPRVRIAPSPTGDPHVGTAYIALFNYVFARKFGGTFILRIEDTDQERYTAGSEAAIFEALHWLGLQWDEGPDVGGPRGPYRQSERLPLYREQVAVLLAKGEAYRCFCSRERLDEVRKQQIADKSPKLGYDGHCRALDPTEAAGRAAAGEAHVVRLRVPEGVTPVVDHLRGAEPIVFENSQIDDQVLLKSDGFPTYHLANVVDDHFMGITHVIRGEEWITSTPKHVLLYRAFGWEPPAFYHLGLLRNADKSKLSKRKNPVSVFHYRDLGYLPETMLNFMANLGFSMGAEVERFTVEQMIEALRLVEGQRRRPGLRCRQARGLQRRRHPGDVGRRAVRAPARARAGPGAHQGDARPGPGAGPPPRRLHPVPQLLLRRQPRLRVRCGQDQGPERQVGRRGGQLLDSTCRRSSATTRPAASRRRRSRPSRASSAQRHAVKAKELFMLLRLGVTGRSASPSLFDTMALCGKDRCRMRMRDVSELLRQA